LRDNLILPHLTIIVKGFLGLSHLGTFCISAGDVSQGFAGSLGAAWRFPCGAAYWKHFFHKGMTLEKDDSLSGAECGDLLGGAGSLECDNCKLNYVERMFLCTSRV